MLFRSLNENDNQGIRYILIAYFADLGRWDELGKFMSRGGYKNDAAAEWRYTEALLAFVQEGPSESAAKKMKIALEANAYAPEYLAGRKSIPRELPDRITLGGEDEGFCYAARSRAAWLKTPGAMDWLKEQAGIRILPRLGRNELCHCGSGKKYKKCCYGI